ncbi:MAG: hypothetical protein SV422_04015 [Pseudomonadota bacterium]|nr:hypothetical protein [Pseudomonadota bacterium]
MKLAPLIRFVACWILLGTSAGAYAQLDGTLFTQPEERAYLDYLRDEFLRNNAEQGFDIAETAIPVVPDAEPAPAGPIEFSFGGIMTRRDGSRSVWLNGVVLAESELPAGMSLVSAGSSTSLRIAHEGKVYQLRPGQTVDLVAGTVVESYQRPQAAPSASEPAAATAPADVQASDPAPAASDQGVNAASESDEDAPPDDANASNSFDAIAAAVDALDGEQLNALLKVLDNRRQQRQAEEDEADEAADDEEP